VGGLAFDESIGGSPFSITELIDRLMSNKDDIDAYAKSLDDRIWITKGSRFNAARRLNNKYQFSITSISILSIYGISIPIIQGIVDYSECPRINEIYTAVSIILSIFILVLSLLEGSKNYQVRAERLYNNAVTLSSLYRDFEYLKECESSAPEFPKKLHEISNKYEKLIRECPDNHEQEDYELFRVQHRKDFNISWIVGIYVRLKLMVMDYWLYLFVLGIPPLVILLYSSC
jgi:hypothetical protein